MQGVALNQTHILFQISEFYTLVLFRSMHRRAGFYRTLHRNIVSQQIQVQGKSQRDYIYWFFFSAELCFRSKSISVPISAEDAHSRNKSPIITISSLLYRVSFHFSCRYSTPRFKCSC